MFGDMQFLTVQWILKSLWSMYRKERQSSWYGFCKSLGFAFGGMDIFIILIVMVLQVGTYVKTYPSVHLNIYILNMYSLLWMNYTSIKVVAVIILRLA